MKALEAAAKVAADLTYEGGHWANTKPLIHLSLGTWFAPYDIPSFS